MRKTGFTNTYDAGVFIARVSHFHKGFERSKRSNELFFGAADTVNIEEFLEYAHGKTFLWEVDFE